MSPHGLAIDGARIWIANTGNNRVSESRLSDGEMIATMPVGVSPQGIVFNGTHIWVTNNGSNTVSRI